MVWEYSEKTKELFMNAVQGKPGTHLGEIENPDGTGEHGSISCGDAMRFTFRVKRHPTDPTQDVITEARYLTFGCTSAIASSEALCAIIEQGRFTPIQALKVTNDDIVRFLDGLPAQKIHCSVMGAEALEAAVVDWAQKRGVNLESVGIHLPSREEQEGRVVCQCFTVTEPYIKRKIKELELRSIADIINSIKAGGACSSCHHAPGGLQDLLDEVWGRKPAGAPAAAPAPVTLTTLPDPEASGARVAPAVPEQGLSPYQFAKKVEEVVSTSIRPMLQSDGGDLEIIDVKDQILYVRLAGACAGCMGATTTLKMMVEDILRRQVDPRIQVIAV